MNNVESIIQSYINICNIFYDCIYKNNSFMDMKEIAGLSQD